LSPDLTTKRAPQRFLVGAEVIVSPVQTVEEESLTMSMCCRPMPVSALMWALSASTPAISGEPAALSVVIHGGAANAEQDRVSRAAMDALPEALLDPQRNFTTHPAYDPERTYRMVLVLCSSSSSGRLWT
jgi:hypothetical protein